MTHLEFVEAALLEVLGLQQVLFAKGPLLVDVTLVTELLGQMVQTLQSTNTCSCSHLSGVTQYATIIRLFSRMASQNRQSTCLQSG